MKIRNGLVSNSSSSSFVVDIYGYKYTYADFLSQAQKVIEFLKSCIDKFEDNETLNEFFNVLIDFDSSYYAEYSEIASFEYISDNFDKLYMQLVYTDDEYLFGIDITKTVINNPDKTWNNICDSVNKFFIKFNKKTDIPFDKSKLQRYYESEVIYS